MDAAESSKQPVRLQEDADVEAAADGGLSTKQLSANATVSEDKPGSLEQHLRRLEISLSCGENAVFGEPLEELRRVLQVHSNYYAVLKVRKDTPQKVIRQNYFKLSKLVHPDKNSDPRATNVTAYVVTAYDTLSNPVKKALYDRYVDHTNTDVPEGSTYSQWHAAQAQAPVHLPIWVRHLLRLPGGPACVLLLLLLLLPFALIGALVVLIGLALLLPIHALRGLLHKTPWYKAKLSASTKSNTSPDGPHSPPPMPFGYASKPNSGDIEMGGEGWEGLGSPPARTMRGGPGGYMPMRDTPSSPDGSCDQAPWSGSPVAAGAVLSGGTEYYSLVTCEEEHEGDQEGGAPGKGATVNGVGRAGLQPSGGVTAPADQGQQSPVLKPLTAGHQAGRQAANGAAAQPAAGSPTPFRPLHTSPAFFQVASPFATTSAMPSATPTEQGPQPQTAPSPTSVSALATAPARLAHLPAVSAAAAAPATAGSQYPPHTGQLHGLSRHATAAIPSPVAAGASPLTWANGEQQAAGTTHGSLVSQGSLSEGGLLQRQSSQGPVATTAAGNGTCSISDGFSACASTGASASAGSGSGSGSGRGRGSSSGGSPATGHGGHGAGEAVSRSSMLLSSGANWYDYMGYTSPVKAAAAGAGPAETAGPSPLSHPPHPMPPPVQSPAAQSPAAQSPATQSPAAQSPAAQSPAAQSPAAQSPAAQSPAAQSPAAQSPAAQSPAAQSPTAQSPTAQSPAAQQPSALSPTAPLTIRLPSSPVQLPTPPAQPPAAPASVPLPTSPPQLPSQLPPSQPSPSGSSSPPQSSPLPVPPPPVPSATSPNLQSPAAANAAAAAAPQHGSLPTAAAPVVATTTAPPLNASIPAAAAVGAADVAAATAAAGVAATPPASKTRAPYGPEGRDSSMLRDQGSTSQGG